MLAVGLERPGPHPVRVEMVLAEPPDVDRPEIVGRCALRDPLGERHAGAPACRDAERVEASADKDAAHLGSLAEDEISIRRETLRPVDELLDAGGLHGWHTAGGKLEQRLEMLQIVVEKLKLEIRGKAVFGPWLWIGLVAAHHQAARPPLSNK